MTKFYKDKQQIINWLDKYEVKHYTLIPDEKYGFVIDVNGDADLSDKNLINIPVKFNEINGSFFCSKNQLISLEFSPQNIDRDFSDNSFFLTCKTSNYEIKELRLSVLKFSNMLPISTFVTLVPGTNFVNLW